MKHTDNLVNRQFGVPQFVSLLNNAEKQNRERYEEALYSVYLVMMKKWHLRKPSVVLAESTL